MTKPLPLLPSGEGAEEGGGRLRRREGASDSAALSLEPVKGGTMITYGDRTFCMRQGCTKKSWKRYLSNVDWSFGLPVSVADFWGKSDKCPKKEQAMMAFQEAEKSDTDT